MSETRTISGERNIPIVIPQCPFKREDYEFIGWSKNPNATQSDVVIE